MMQSIYSYQTSLLGKSVELQLFVPNRSLAKKVFSVIQFLEAKLTVNREYSQLMQVNKLAGIESVQVTDDIFFLVERAHQASFLKSSCFNLTMGALVKCWKIGFVGEHLPLSQQAKKLLQLTNPHDVIFNKQQRSLYLAKKGMEIDLGAIGKDYIADVVKKLLNRKGIESAMLNLGGNIYVIGENLHNRMKQWSIGLQKPFAKRNESIGSIKLCNKTVVTSGIYERYFFHQNKLYHHILDPKTGYPIENELYSVTVICDHSIDADIYTTVLFGMGLDKALAYLQTKPEIEAIFVTKQNEVIASSNRQFDFQLLDNRFKFAQRLANAS